MKVSPKVKPSLIHQNLKSSMHFSKWLPILSWLPQYKKSNLQGDIFAGLTVGVMLIPQGMAYAYIAGLPPVYGLYASIVPQIIYAFLGTSRQLAIGPVALDSLIVASGIIAFAEAGSEEYISLAIILALMVGIIQLVFGVLRLGFLVNFLSRPVISGFTFAASLMIAFSQLKHLLGISLINSNQIQLILIDVFHKIADTHLLTFILGSVGILIVFLIKNISEKYKIALPSSLIIVIFGILAVLLFQLDSQGVKIIKEIPSGLPSVGIENFHFEKWVELFPIALTISLIAFMEAISVGKVMEAKHKDHQIDPNQELVALGLANIVGAFFKSYSTTAGLSRSAVNDQAGAKTGVAALVSATLMIFTLLFFTSWFYYLPQAVLASIIMIAVLGLMDLKYAQRLFQNQREEFFMFLITFLLTLTLGILEGILIGVLLSIALVIYQTTRPHYAVLGRLPETQEYRNLDRFPEVIRQEEILIVRYDASLYFANLSHFTETLDRLIGLKGESMKLLILSCDSMNRLDSSALEMLSDFHKKLISQDIQLYIAGMIGPLRDLTYKVGLTQQIGEQHFFLDIQAAVDYFINENSLEAKRSSAYARQTNR
jgi:SulP family sulfate permease